MGGKGRNRNSSTEGFIYKCIRDGDVGECAEKERDPRWAVCLKLVGSPFQSTHMMDSSGCWHSPASSLAGPSLQQLPGGAGEVAAPLEDQGACD